MVKSSMEEVIFCMNYYIWENIIKKGCEAFFVINFIIIILALSFFNDGSNVSYKDNIMNAKNYFNLKKNFIVQ
jgi:hypothetical protein